jgi:hypothetical protein
VMADRLAMPKSPEIQQSNAIRWRLAMAARRLGAN